MDLAALQIFKTVAEEGGIVKAARTLHRVPSNVTTRRMRLSAAPAPMARRRELRGAPRPRPGLDHAIVACVASGTGIALVPESVLDTVQDAQVRRHPIPKVHAHVVTPLIWRVREESAALVALKEELQRGGEDGRGAHRTSR
jgi:DNA-binding transcriptional LysR family regulator